MEQKELKARLEESIIAKHFSYPFRSFEVEIVDKARVAIVLKDRNDVEKARIFVSTDRPCENHSNLSGLSYNTRCEIEKRLCELE